MAVESAADRAVFVGPDEFGATATYTPVVGSAVAVAGIFDNGSIDAFGEPGMVSTGPRFVCRTADLPTGAKADDTLTIAGTAYFVRALRPDGTGMIDLQLEAV